MSNKHEIDIMKYKDELVKDIQELVQIKSVRDVENKEPGAPFGPGIRKVMDAFLKISTKCGLSTFIDPEGYYAYAEVGPADAEMIGIIGHLDTVPEGDLEQWTLASPFSGDIVDEMIVGRGSIDDKGPVIINLYAIKALLDSNIKLTKRIRVIVGGAEETTWEGIDKYVREQELPTLGYSPDAEFPLIYAEKAIVRSDINGKGSTEFTINAPGAYNAVNDHAIYTGPKTLEIKKYVEEKGLSTKIEEDKLHIYGKSAHSMESFIGTNSILHLAQALYENDINHPLTDFLAKQITTDVINTKVFGKVEEDESGVLTTNIGLATVDENHSTFGIDLRVPVLVEYSEIVDKLVEQVEASGLTYKNTKTTDKLYVDKDSDLIKSLQNAYVEVTNDTKLKPLAIGGGTYARSFDNCVAFGAMFIDRDMKSDIHQPNEAYEIKHMISALDIYVQALINLNN